MTAQILSRLSILAAPAMLALVFVCCSDRTPGDQPLPDQRPAQVDANSYERWVYFSFAVGDTIPAPADPSRSPAWDLAFHMWDIRTNSGASGMGQGGAYRSDASDPSALLDPFVIPREELFVVDDSIRTFMSTPNMRPGAGIEQQKVRESGSTVLAEWIGVSLATMPPVITFEPKVFWVRRADGGYAVVQFVDYLDDKGTSFKFYPKFDYWLK